MTVKPSFSERFSDFYVRHEYAVFFLFVLVWQAVLLSAGHRRMIETDNFTHALRLLDFIQSGSWKETLYMHDNCPYGQMLHFTRITDMFMYVMTLPFLPFMDVKDAVLYGCFLYNPVLACLSAAALVWAGKAFFSPLARAFSVVLYFGASTTVNMFIAGRPDHHVLLNLLVFLLAGNLLHGIKTQKTAYFKAAGLFAGLSAWATPEGFLVGMLFLGSMVAAWLTRYQNVRQIRLFCQFFFISATACLIANPPMQGLFYPDNGRLSFLMAVVLGLASLSFYAEEVLERKKYIRSFVKRFLSLLLLTSVSLGIAVLMFGTKALFSSPIPEELIDIWASKISELQPGYRGYLSDAFVSIPLDSCCIGVIAFFLASNRIRKILMIFCLPLIVTTALTMMINRFARIENPFAVLVLPFSLQIFLGSFSFSRQTISVFKFSGAIVLLYFFVVQVVRYSYYIQETWPRKVDLTALLPHLSQKEGCFLADNDRGPELAWLTGKAVIGSPYHSNAQGILDNHYLLNSRKKAELASLLKKRGIGTIILDMAFHGDAKSDRELLKRIYFKKEDICFIRPVFDLPPEVKGKVMLFDVDFTACDQPGK